MGDYALKASFDTFLERSIANPGSPRPDLARLPGVRLVTAVEASARAGLDAVLLKELSGGDTLTVRTLHKEPFSFKPQCKIVLASNEAPKVSDQDTGVWRRLRRLPFECVIPEGERNPKVKAMLADPNQGGPAVLAWAARGCLEWQRRGLGTCDLVRRRTQELRAEMDPLAAFFEDCCVFGATYEVAAKTLREVYETWCRENGVRKPIDNEEWGKRLEAKGCESTRGYRCGIRVRLWAGVGLLTGDDDPTVGQTGQTNALSGIISLKGNRDSDSGNFIEKGRLSVPSVPSMVEVGSGHQLGPRIGDLVYLLSQDGTIQNREPWAIGDVVAGPDGQEYALFEETTTGWPLRQCAIAKRGRGRERKP